MQIMDDSSQRPLITRKSLLSIFLKTLLLLVICNLAYLVFNPIPILEKISLYNWILPGRERFPFGEDPQHAYNLSLFSFPAMFASHVVSGDSNGEEYRVFLLGDSSVWGTLLHPADTLAGWINVQRIRTCDGRSVHAYNLGYPTLSLFKDLLILDMALPYKPDMIVWLVTLESFPRDNQLSTPIIANNSLLAKELILKFDLPYHTRDPVLIEKSAWEKTLFGQRRPLADFTRLQLYGFLWAATGIDQVYPQDYPPALRDLENDLTFHGMQPPALPEEEIAWEILEAGFLAAHDIPMLLVNEPILVSSGKNSDIRYNFFYPRWAYDEYRRILQQKAGLHGWRYLDAWGLVAPDQFTNSAIHLTAAGSHLLSGQIIKKMSGLQCLQ